MRLRRRLWRMRKSVLATAGGVGAAFLASVCCIGPILLVTVGIGAGVAAAFEPLRPLFGVLMLLLFGFGFYGVYGRYNAVPESAAAGQACARSGRVRDRVLLWVGFFIAVVIWSFPTWSVWLL